MLASMSDLLTACDSLEQTLQRGFTEQLATMREQEKQLLDALKARDLIHPLTSATRMSEMTVTLAEGSIHHLKTMEMLTALRIGEEVVVDNEKPG